MVKLWLLLDSGIALIKLDNHLVNSFKVIKHDKEVVLVRACFKDVPSAILFCVNNRDQFTAVTDKLEESKGWIVLEEY